MRPSAPCDRRRVPCDAGRRWFGVLLFWAAWLIGHPGWAQETVLIREIQSREYAVFLGHEPTPTFKEMVSREVGLAISTGPADPLAQVVSREVGLVMTDAPPPPRVQRLSIVNSPTGESVVVRWTDYNPWAVGDIARFDIYLSDDGPFASVVGRTPIASVGGETTEITLTGLTAYRDHFIAVVPVDALGAYDATVNYGAAYVLSSEIVSREWAVHVASGDPDELGQLVSREVGVILSTPEAPPRITELVVETSATGETVRLDWSGYNQWAVGDIARFDVYLADDAPFTTVAGRTPYRSVPAESVSLQLTGLTPWTDHYFAVVPVDAAGNFEATVEYSAAYVLTSQIVSREFGVFMETGPAEPYAQVISREFGVVAPDGQAPAPVTGVGSGFVAETSRTALGAVDLDWTAYNEAAQLDVVRYRIYVGNAFFESVTGLTPFAYVPAGTQRHTLTGLSGLAILHFAVVAEDVTGEFDPVVRSHSAQASIAGVGEVTHLAVRSEATALEFSWEAPTDAGAFLAGYRVYLGDATEPVDLAASVLSWRAENLTRAQGYSFRILTRDVFGHVSSGTSLLAATWLENPTGVGLTAIGETARLFWSGSTPAALVGRYAVYRGDGAFGDLTGLTPVGTTTGTTYDLGTLDAVNGKHFAVATVNVSDGFDPAVVSVSASKQRQTIDFPTPALGGLAIPLTATASSGLAVQFGASPSDVAVVEGTVLKVLRGGTVTVTARQAGNEDYWPAESSWTVRLPPVIRSFLANGVELTPETTLTAMFVDFGVTVDDREGPNRVQFFRRAEGTTDWTLWATDEQGGNGWGARVSLVPIPPGAYDVRALVTTASGAWSERIVRVTLDPVLLPDLAAVALTAPATAHAGQTVAVGWTVTNHGPGAVSGPWKTRFLLSRDPTGAGAVDRGLVTAEGPLAPGETRVQSASPIVPADWFGPAYLVVEVDAQSQVSEADEGNNRTVAASPLQILAPDLVADRLTAPRTLTLGEVLEARWTVTNRGSAPTSVAWRDRIWLSRSAVTREGAFELGSVAGPSESLAPSAGYEAGGSFTVPLASSLPAGAYFVWVEADGDRAQPEVSDANNRVTAPIDLTLPPVPDLAVTELIAPAVARPGATVMLTWTVTNRGVVGAQGVWRESLSVSNAAQGPRELTLLTSTNDLLPGGRIERSASVVLPAGTSGGEAVFRVIVDASGEVVESDETNNDRAASASTQVPRVLGLSLELAAVREDQAEPVRAVVTRNGDPAAALPVTITVSDRGELVASLPSLGSDGAGARYALTIPAGQAAAAFELVAVPDQAVDGDQSVGVGAAAEGYEGADATLRVLDADRPRLSLTATTTRVTEGGTLAVQVTRDVVTAEPVTVNLVSSSPGQLSPPAVVTIPGGAAAVGFTVLAVDDVNAEPPGAYTLTASAAGFHDGSLGLAVDDNDLAPLTVALSVRSVGEGAGNAALAMTVTRTPSGPGPLALEPFASDPAAVVLPLQIVIPAGQASRSFPVGIVDDGLVNGTRTIRLGAYALAAGTGVRLAESPTEALEILDDDGPALRLAVARKLVPEGLPAATEVTVTRNTPPDAALAVVLATSDATEARVPAGITLPIGETSATFALESVADGVQDGNQTVTLRASAPGFAEGVDTVVVSDVDLPDLVVESITVPAGATPGQRVAVAFRIANQGVGVSDQAVLNRVHLSRDPAVGDDVLAAQSQVTSRLEPGQTIDRTEMITLPMEAGRFWVVVETDAGQAVGEILENNNTAISAAAIEIEPDYAAWVATEVDSDLAGTPVPLHGGATNRLGAPVSHVPVTVHVRVRGTERRLSATTDATGLFALEFEPLPGEGGNYALFATHPATASVPVQDNFVLIGFRPLPARQALVVTEGGARTASVELQNLADVALLEVAAEVVEQPAGLGVSLELAAVAASVRAGGGASPGGRRELLSTRRNPSAPTRAAALRTGVVRAPAEGQARGLHAVPARLLGDGGPTLPALGSLMLNASIAAATGEGSGLVKLRVTTAEGAAQEVEIAVRVEPLKPRLVANPPSLEAAMVVGGQAVVEFDVVNLGGRASGPVTVALPDLPWMAVASPNPVDELLPGATNRVTLRLAPPADLPLGPYTGNLVVNSADSGVAVPFRFRAVSEARGDLFVDAVDEYTYYAEGAPHVAGARVVVRESFTQEVVASGVTDDRGLFSAPGLPVAYYDLEVTADKHTSFRATRLLQAGVANEVLAFLRRETVTYNWTVEPITIEDRYRVTIDTTFETMVPVPVVTVEPSVIDLATLVDEETHFELRITNHGLIAANNVRLQFPTDPLWEFTPLLDELGTLPARTEVSIPLTVRRLGPLPAPASAGRGTAANGDGGGPCALAAQVLWDLICLDVNTYAAGIAMPNARFGCGGTWLGTGGGGGGWVGPGYSGPVIATTLPCDPCIAKATVECLIGLTPYGDAYGWAKCLWSGSTGSSEALEDCLTAPLPGPVGCAWGYLRCKCKGDLLSVPGCVRDLVRGAFDPAGDPHGLGDGTSTAGDALDYFAALTYPSFELLRVIVDDTDGRWLEAGARPYTDAWYAAFGNRVRKDSDAGILVSETEAAELRAMAVGGGLTTPDFEHAIERWNRSITNWRAGVFEVSELPAGGDPNFITRSALQRIAGNLLAAEAKAKESGYDTPEDAFRATLNADADEAPSGGICARVKLRLEQEAVLTRDAFRATLELDNNGASRLENVSVDVIVLNEAGQIATDRFGIRFEGSTTLSGVDGAGILPGNSTGTARWTLIPTVDAAPETTTRFLVGGTLRYRLDGTDVVVDMTPVPILVHPSPRLSLQYFHQRDVFSDDPFTDELEPAVPYSLGVLVRNRGFGPAKNFRITSAQPKIIENEKGLLIDFNIVATELFAPGGFHELTPSLTVSFGDLSPGESAVGRWLMVSSLQGLFIDYTATWEHIDGMGNPRLSLIDDLSIHEMIRTVRAGGLWEDGRPDFLVNDIPDARDRPDTLYQSNGTTNRVEVVEQASVSGTVGPGNLAVTLTASMPAAWVYLRVPDPGQGRYRLARVVRSDGTVLSANTNVWITDRTFIGLARRPIPESILHLLDYNSTGQYTLEYSDEGSGWVDDVAPTSAVEALPASVMPWFQVRWAGRDQGRLGETASGLASYDVFVSEEGGPFVPWLTRTKLVSVTYLGEFGRRYAFYSVATDGAGNREEAPAAADAQTVADRVNAPPTIVLPASVSTEEGAPLDLTVRGDDPDGAEQLLTFALLPGHPPGMSIDSLTGLLSWPTGESEGGTTRTINLVVTDNGYPSLSATGAVQVVVREVNRPPIAVGDRLVRPSGERIRFPESQLLANDLDVDGDSLVLVGVSSATANGGSVRRVEGWISYLPPTGNDADDRFTYVIGDGTFQATGVVEVTVGAPSDAGSLNILGTSVGPDGAVHLRLVGVPGRTFEVQLATQLTEPIWTTIGTATADADGRFEFIHATPPLGAAFYRAVLAGTIEPDLRAPR